VDQHNAISRRSLIQQGAAAYALTSSPLFAPSRRIPDKLVILTLDDAVKSHRTFVAPLLKELGFRATFFVTHRWMDDTEHFMTWDDIAELHRMGFEIGNHSWTHPNFAEPATAARVPEELGLVEEALRKVGVPRPISFAYSGNGFGPEAVEGLKMRGYHLARRGMQPEVAYGKMEVGPTFDVTKNHPLLVPTTGDAYPDWTLDHFKKVAARARDGQIAVFQFHGVPDIAHPWVHTPPERFRQYMAYLKENKFRAVALTEVERYLDRKHLPDDPLLTIKYTKSNT
jgi:peptidoglycan/xylan/chitin deacetylase (PgdA/CDA1 family)